MPFNVKKRSGDRSHIIFQVPTSQVCLHLHLPHKKIPCQKGTSPACKYKNVGQCTLKGRYLHFQGSTQARLDESTVNSFSQNVMRLRASKEDCCRPTNRYFVTKIVLTYSEKKLFQWTKRTFEIWFWRPRICKIFKSLEQFIQTV